MNIKWTLLGTVVFSLLSTQVNADSWRHRDDERGWHGHRRDYNHRDYHRPRSSISFNFGNAGWYRPHPPIYRTQQVIYTQPVIMSPPPVQIAADDRYCREYQTTSRVGGRLQPSYGTACYQPDGSWQIVAD